MPNLITPEILSQYDEADVQTVFGPQLRALAINLLRTGNGLVCRSFRGEYSSIYPGDSKATEKFLQQQAGNVPATYIELEALAEYFGFSVVITYDNGQNQEQFNLYKAEDEKAPVIHLKNIKNYHWEFNGYTSGKNNDCLFNAIAKVLRAEGIQRQSKVNVSSEESIVNRYTLSGQSALEMTQVYEQQQKLLRDHLKEAPKPSQIKRDLEAELLRISQLSPKEQLQIRQDREYCIQLLIQDLKTPHSDAVQTTSKNFSSTGSENQAEAMFYRNKP